MTNLKLVAIAIAAFTFGLFSDNLLTMVLAHGGNLNFVHACVRTSNGSIRIVGANDTCSAGETSLDWSQNGIGTFGGFTTNQLIGYRSAGESFDYRLFDGVNFTNAVFPADSMRFASFVNGNFQGASLEVNTEGANFSSTNFSSADIHNSSFINTNFSGANFTAAIFTSAVVQNTNFTNANFTNANLLGVNFTNSTRTGVIWSNTTCPDGTNSNNNGGTCEGHLVPTP